jgi:hypothetical protein
MTPWEEIYRSMVGQLGTGAFLEPATLYLDVIETRGDYVQVTLRRVTRVLSPHKRRTQSLR